MTRFFANPGWLASSSMTVMLSAISVAAAAQVPAATPAFSPALVARNYFGPGGAQPTHPLTIERLDINIDVAGGAARTVVTATFKNPTASALEGDFSLTLPAGAVITGYALDVNGVMTDGVLVGKRKAERVYKQAVRRGVDPGIAEQTEDNAYRTHIFPVLSGRGRTVRLEFVAPIGAGTPYVLPLATLDPVGVVRLQVKAPGSRPTLTAPSGLGFAWQSSEGGEEAIATAAHAVLAGALTLTDAAAPGPVTLTRHHDGDTFFTIDSAPARAAAGHRINRVRIYWHRSLSRGRDDTASEISILKSYLAAVGARTVDLVTFNSDGPKVRTFSSGAVADDVVAAIQGLDYGGATSLKGLFAADPNPAEACLFFSDGRITVDRYQLEPAHCPLFTLSSAADADHGFLSALARRSGGEHFDLRVQPATVLAKLVDDRVRVTAVTTAGGEPAPFTVLPSAPGRFRIVGRTGDPGPVKVTLSDGEVLSFDTDASPAIDQDGPASLWAADRVAELNASDRPDQAQSLALARRYGVAVGDIAYLVLETLNDYVQAQVAPPESASKAIKAAYADQLARLEAQKAKDRDDRMELVIREWKEEEAWRRIPLQAVARPKSGVGPAVMAREAAPLVRSVQAPPDVAPPPPLPIPPVERPVAPPPAAAPPASSMRRPAPEFAEVTVTARRAGGRDTPSDAVATITTEPWNPARPYLTALKAAPAADFWTVFKVQETQHGTLPAFYLDVAELLYRSGRAADAAAMALNALELPLADDATLCIVGDREMRYGDVNRGVALLEHMLFLEPDRPQPRRLLALALIERADRGGTPALRRADYLRAVQLLNGVITRPWPQEFSGIELVAIVEANHLLAKLQRLGVKDIPLDARLRSAVDVDLRVVLDWYVDATDMDLWVDEPSGERAIYNHPRTAIGGRLSHDMTQGYGPEEYLLRQAPGGRYDVRVNIYATDRLNPNGAVTVRAHIFQNYGRPTEKEQVAELQLDPGEHGARLVGHFQVAAKPARK